MVKIRTVSGWNRWLTIILLIAGIATIGVLGLFQQAQSDTNSYQFSVSSFLHARRIVKYEQPSAELIKRISAVYDVSHKDESLIPESCRGLDIVMIDDVPFHPYWQGEIGKYAFHPMALGRFLSHLDCDEPVARYIDAAMGMAHKLPNGGLLWYYPDNYKLNRFLGPDLSPSAVGQSQILGAITSLDKRCRLGLSKIARRVFLGLSYDYYKGGVNFENKALLEIPLFRSAPEIILNGWLHALLNLRNYVEQYQDPQAKELLYSNLKFLAESLGNFHDEKTGLSLYSDLSPYRVRVYHKSGVPSHLTAFYKARIKGFDDLAFDLKVIQHETNSPYDNQIIRQTKSFTDVWISCSKNYETYLVSDVPIRVRFYTGEYSPHRSAPGKGGERIELESIKVNGYYVVHITAVRDKLFCGYPTNFSKMGENYYHTYHVVALAALLASVDMPSEVRASLKAWMEKWINTIETFNSSQGLVFSSYEKILRDLNEHEVFTLYDDWETLLQMARKAGR